MDPRREGQLMHAVFEAFFRAWQKSGRGAITPKNIDDARAVFTEVVEASLDGLPEAEAGSPADAPAGVSSRSRARRSDLSHGSRAADRSGHASAGVSAPRRVRDCDSVRAAIGHPQWKSRSARPARGRHLPPDRLQARLATRQREASLQLPIYGLCASVQLTERAQARLDARRSGLCCLQRPATRRPALHDARLAR